MRSMLVGRVAVDSATLVITDPSNLDREWVKTGDVEPYAVNCFGRDVEALVAALRGLDSTGDIVPMGGGSWYRVFPSDGHSALQIRAEAVRLQETHQWLGAVTAVGHDSLERVHQAVNDRVGGEIGFSHGNPAFMTAIQLPADGIYEVHVEVDDTPSGAQVRSITMAVG